MAPLADMQAFFRFLEDPHTSVQELEVKRSRLAWFLQNVKDTGVKQDARYLLRKIEQELLSRL